MTQLMKVNSTEGSVSKDNFNHFLAVCTNRALNRVAWTFFSDQMF